MSFLRDPLLHFLLIGAAIFGLYGGTNDTSDTEPDGRLVVTAGDVARLRSLWEKQWQRPPTAEELRGAIEEQVREEVLYREALALGLDRDDAIVRRRLAQKFEFLTEDFAASRTPQPAELLTYFQENRERYRTSPRLSFTQVYFNLDRRGTATKRDAELALVSLRSGSTIPDAAGLGDGLMLEKTYRRLTAQDIAAVFGSEFAEAVLRLGPGAWHGPLASGYGLHLVRIDERIAGEFPRLNEIEQQVRDDWFYDERQRANDAVYRRLLARYEVTIEGAAPVTETERETGIDQEIRP
jgi:hypothetical protein